MSPTVIALGVTRTDGMCGAESGRPHGRASPWPCRRGVWPAVTACGLRRRRVVSGGGQDGGYDNSSRSDRGCRRLRAGGRGRGKGLGTTRVVQLVEAGLVADLADVFALTRDQLLSLERMGETSTDNLLTAINAAKGQPLSRVLCALGVRGTGRSMSRRIARYFATMDHIRAADAATMQQVEGIGTEKAPSIVGELADLAPLIDKLTAAGVNMTEPGVTPPAPASDDSDSDGGVQSAEPAGGPLAGMTVVVTGAMTGALEKLSRNRLNELIERAGGRASSSVSKKTTLVVAGDNAGSKRAKAEDLAIRLATPGEFATLIADYLN